MVNPPPFGDPAPESPTSPNWNKSEANVRPKFGAVGMVLSAVRQSWRTIGDCRAHQARNCGAIPGWLEHASQWRRPDYAQRQDHSTLLGRSCPCSHHDEVPRVSMHSAFATAPAASTIPITFATKATWDAVCAGLPADARQFALANAFTGKPGSCLTLPGSAGK